jgi:hypothetical protein
MTFLEMKAFAVDVMNRQAERDPEKLALAQALYSFCVFYETAKKELVAIGIDLNEGDLGAEEEEEDVPGGL